MREAHCCEYDGGDKHRILRGWRRCQPSMDGSDGVSVGPEIGESSGDVVGG